jgi:hypothetical protein
VEIGNGTAGDLSIVRPAALYFLQQVSKVDALTTATSWEPG